MSDLRTNPFRKRPAFLARQPRLVRLFVFHSFVGFCLSAVFTGLILITNTANIGHLVATVNGGGLAALVFFALNGMVFASVQISIVIMSLGDDIDPDHDPRNSGPVRQPGAIYVMRDPRR